MTTPSMLAKKTKQEILQEYEKLLEQFEEVRGRAGTAFGPQSSALIAQGRTQSSDTVLLAVNDLKAAINQRTGSLTRTFEDELTTVLNLFLEKTKELEALQQAIEASRQMLETQHHIQVAAEALELLVQEHETKRQSLEQELGKRRAELEEEIEHTKREWQRQQEELGYTTKRDRTREELERKELQTKQEQELARRTETILAQEQEVVRMRAELEQQPTRVEQAAKQREIEVTKKLETEARAKLETASKAWEAERQLLEARIGTLSELVKRQDGETLTLKKETEAAQKKAQELAVKVIESGVRQSSEQRPAQQSTPLSSPLQTS